MKPSIHALFVASLFAAAFDLQAVLMKPLPLAELSQRDDLIVHGTVLSKTCQRDDAGRIFTKIELKVTEIWKGAVPGGTLTIFQGGGTVGNERVEVSGEAQYAIGEEVVAFLVVNPRGLPITLALGQGKFHVWQDRQTGEKFAHNLFHGATEQKVGSEALAPEHTVARPAARLKLKDLKQHVRGGKL